MNNKWFYFPFHIILHLKKFDINYILFHTVRKYLEKVLGERNTTDLTCRIFFFFCPLNFQNIPTNLISYALNCYNI